MSTDGLRRFDFATLPAPLRYKLLVGLVVPRPIAFITSCDRGGQLNAAPFSFFNIFSEAPPLLVVGIDGSSSTWDGLKDTARNIEARGEFVVNLVDEQLLPAMNECAVDVAPEIDEMALAALTTLQSTHVSVPGIMEAPVHIECRLETSLPVGDAGRRLILGEVLGITTRSGIVDPDTHRVDIDQLNLIGRLHGAGNYVRLTDRLILPRKSARK